MMDKLKFYIIVFVISLVGCKKQIFDSSNNMGGCTDLNAINYLDSVDFEDNTCKYAYINQYEVSYYPEDNPNSSIPFVNSLDIPLRILQIILFLLQFMTIDHLIALHTGQPL